MTTESGETTEVHSCSYFCDRPGCIKAQRDELRATKALPAGVERDAKIRLNEDGSLDEVVGGTGIHLEQMDTNHWWMAVYHPTGRVTVNFHARGKITAHAERERDATPQPNAEPPND